MKNLIARLYYWAICTFELKVILTQNNILSVSQWVQDKYINGDKMYLFLIKPDSSDFFYLVYDTKNEDWELYGFNPTLTGQECYIRSIKYIYQLSNFYKACYDKPLKLIQPSCLM
jgi:hypothetical protein